LKENDLLQFMQNTKLKIDKSLEGFFPEASDDLTICAARYSLLSGGKRIRPLLMLASSFMLNVKEAEIIPFACAIEMIHTYSLIHDDLPCMDNDVLRRGVPTCHVQFSEAIALLAGDALLNSAYELLWEHCIYGDIGRLKAARFISQAAGISGMIGGQSIDITSEQGSVTPEILYDMHNKKTGALIEAAIMTPLFLSQDIKDFSRVKDSLNSFSKHLGLSFQIKDDLLDLLSSSKDLGKSTGKDEATSKCTFVTVFGAEKAKKLFEEEVFLTFSAMDDLEKMGYNVDLLRGIAEYLREREK
jgi:geranylgeranyl diphosphate synthase type II